MTEMNKFAKYILLYMSIIIFLIISFSYSANAQQQQVAPISGAAQEEKILVGESKVIRMPFPGGQFVISDPKVATFHIEAGKDGVVVGRAPGTAVLTIFDTSGTRRMEVRIVVLTKNLQEYMAQIKNLVGDIEGITYRIVGNDIVIDGEVFKDADLERVKQVVGSNPQIINLVKLSPLTQQVMAQKIEKAIGIPGVTAKPVKDKILLEGVVYSKESRERAIKVAKTYADNIVDAIEIRQTPIATRDLADKVEKAINIPTVKVKMISDKLLLEGTVYSKEDQDRAVKIAKAYSENVVDVLQVRPVERTAVEAKTVQISVQVIEIHKDAFRELGVKWSGSINPETGLSAEAKFGPGQSGGIVGTIVGTIKDLLPSIKFLDQTGKARILYNPTLVVKSGSKANLLVGGEVPVPVVQSVGGVGGVSIEYKEYGVKMNVEPVVDTKNNVDIKLVLEISNIAGVGAQGMPVFTKSTINTNVFVGTGESIVLGGLISQRDREGVQKVPGLGSIPILGELFKSREFQKNQTELVVFMTPTVFGRGSEAGEELKGKVEKSFKEYDEKKR